MAQPEILKPKPAASDLQTQPDFSLLGGPLYQLDLRTRLARPPPRVITAVRASDTAYMLASSAAAGCVGWITRQDQPRFEKLIAWATRLRNSVTVELVLPYWLLLWDIGCGA